MILTDLLEICRDYSDLGTAVQRQLWNVVEGEPLSEQNENALAVIADFLESCTGYGDDARDAEAKAEADGIRLYLRGKGGDV